MLYYSVCFQMRTFKSSSHDSLAVDTKDKFVGRNSPKGPVLLTYFQLRWVKVRPAQNIEQAIKGAVWMSVRQFPKADNYIPERSAKFVAHRRKEITFDLCRLQSILTAFTRFLQRSTL